MKKVGVMIFASCSLILASGYFANLPGANTHLVPELVGYETFTLDTLTIYNPCRKQCDSDPLVTASNKHINIHRLKSGSIRWMALSRDMLKRWGGKLTYGDTVTLYARSHAIDGIWVIQDTMNKRYKRRGDLLFDAALRSTGMWTNVSITRRISYAVQDDSRPPVVPLGK